jgi:hypothetical protein
MVSPQWGGVRVLDGMSMPNAMPALRVDGVTLLTDRNGAQVFDANGNPLTDATEPQP